MLLCCYCIPVRKYIPMADIIIQYLISTPSLYNQLFCKYTFSAFALLVAISCVVNTVLFSFRLNSQSITAVRCCYTPNLQMSAFSHSCSSHLHFVLSSLSSVPHCYRLSNSCNRQILKVRVFQIMTAVLSSETVYCKYCFSSVLLSLTLIKCPSLSSSSTHFIQNITTFRQAVCYSDMQLDRSG